MYISDTGNHELKTVGVFNGRSTSTLSRDKDKLVQNNELAQVDAVTDARIIEVCEVTPWGGPCVLRDGFQESMVSTLGWSGELINELYAFDEGSVADVLTASDDDITRPGFIEYKPCFYNVNGVLSSPADGAIGVLPPFSAENPMDGFGLCHQTWITAGFEVRKHCLDAQVGVFYMGIMFLIISVSVSVY